MSDMSKIEGWEKRLLSCDTLDHAATQALLDVAEIALGTKFRRFMLTVAPDADMKYLLFAELCGNHSCIYFSPQGRITSVFIAERPDPFSLIDGQLKTITRQEIDQDRGPNGEKLRQAVARAEAMLKHPETLVPEERFPPGLQLPEKPKE